MARQYPLATSELAASQSQLSAAQQSLSQEALAGVAIKKADVKAAAFDSDKALHVQQMQQAAEVVERFKKLYQNFETTQQACESAEQLDDERLTLEQVYSQTISFRDPLHEIKGLNDLRRYMQAMYGNVISCEFVYLDQWLAFDSASIKWDMVFKHRKLGGGKTITVRGISHVRFTDRIHYHEDVFDAGAMIYQQLPLLGRFISKIKSRLSV
jgi:proline dehydrogenase